MEGMEEEMPERDILDNGPLSLLYDAVKSNSQIMVSLRNNHKLLGRVKAYDRHCNMVLEDVREVWSETSTNKKDTIMKDRKISKMFLRGDSVVLVVKNATDL